MSPPSNLEDEEHEAPTVHKMPEKKRQDHKPLNLNHKFDSRFRTNHYEKEREKEKEKEREKQKEKEKEKEKTR